VDKVRSSEKGGCRCRLKRGDCDQSHRPNLKSNTKNFPLSSDPEEASRERSTCHPRGFRTEYDHGLGRHSVSPKFQILSVVNNVSNKTLMSTATLIYKYECLQANCDRLKLAPKTVRASKEECRSQQSEQDKRAMLHENREIGLSNGQSYSSAGARLPKHPGQGASGGNHPDHDQHRRRPRYHTALGRLPPSVELPCK